LWLLDQESSDYLVAQFAELPATYVADGHHRAASAFNVGKEMVKSPFLVFL
jgi:uncharacterized protein (DUF1015 family)